MLRLALTIAAITLSVDAALGEDLWARKRVALDAAVQRVLQMNKPKSGPKFGTTPSTLDLSGGETHIAAPLPFDARDLALANALFPSASQEEQRAQFLIEQERRRAANEINRSKPLIFPVR